MPPRNLLPTWCPTENQLTEAAYHAAWREDRRLSRRMACGWRHAGLGAVGRGMGRPDEDDERKETGRG